MKILANIHATVIRSQSDKSVDNINVISAQLIATKFDKIVVFYILVSIR